MKQIGTENGLTPREDRAAWLVAADELSDEAIAAECKIGRTTLHRWRQQSAFQQRVAEHASALEAETQRHAIAKRRKRVAALQRRWDGMHRVIDERAQDVASGGVMVETPNGRERIIAPGWETGLLVRTEKQIGAGERAVHVVEFAVDTGLLKELRAHEEQAAKELGQWSEKHEHSGEVTVRRYIGVDVDAV